MSDEMINKTKPYNKSSGIQGIGDTVKGMELWSMNEMTDPIEGPPHPGPSGSEVKKLNKNS